MVSALCQVLSSGSKLPLILADVTVWNQDGSQLWDRSIHEPKSWVRSLEGSGIVEQAGCRPVGKDASFTLLPHTRTLTPSSRARRDLRWCVIRSRCVWGWDSLPGEEAGSFFLHSVSCVSIKHVSCPQPLNPCLIVSVLIPPLSVPTPLTTPNIYPLPLHATIFPWFCFVSEESSSPWTSLVLFTTPANALASPTSCHLSCHGGWVSSTALRLAPADRLTCHVFVWATVTSCWTRMSKRSLFSLLMRKKMT